MKTKTKYALTLAVVLILCTLVLSAYQFTPKCSTTPQAHVTSVEIINARQLIYIDFPAGSFCDPPVVVASHDSAATLLQVEWASVSGFTAILHGTPGMTARIYWQAVPEK